ncbi:hypothetical protein [Sphingobacterium deserti]|uniref:Uncharacterized protein n=1 Tax=Sphingobacterium deserti TaxID=1229276 RepID=A0A0B8T4Z5_9SPHI|nr:hypothetical protein [Sphingobacterium deserti]KGE12419.1 hypothetical protein DI53_3797 [Sphingobacterium deserti]
MQWEVDNQNIDVLVTEGDVIEIARWDDYAKIVYIPAKMPKSEALWSIRNLLRQKQQIISASPTRELHVFGKQWPVTSIKKGQKTYMRDGTIFSYIPLNDKTISTANRIKSALLQQIVFAAMDRWEHFYASTVAEIKFRKNDRQPFICNPKTGCITFDSGLHRFKIDQIEYAVYCAVRSFNNLAQADSKVLQRHFPHRKTTEKIFCYEYEAYD